MASSREFNDMFERRLIYPDADTMERYGALVGLDEQKSRLIKALSVSVNPGPLTAWFGRHHPDARDLLKTLLRRPPLVVLAGDVGTGKTELAETVGDVVARQQKIDVTLLPMSLSTRGQGRVGEMTQLLSAAFDYTYKEARKLMGPSGRNRGAIILLVDEADALAQSREAAQMHHEDRAGVNAFIRGIDRIANARLPAAVIMCTNRLSALDPAVRRRAADTLLFFRPNSVQRFGLLQPYLQDLSLSEESIRAIVEATGKRNGRDYGFTYSDLVQKLLPAIVLDAYPDRPVDAARALDIAKRTVPTAPFSESGA